MGLLASIGDGLAEVGGTVAKMGLDQFRSAVEEERQARMAELQSRIKMRDDTIIRDRNKGDAAEERARVKTEAQDIADKRGGLLSQSATDAYSKLAETDPEGAKLGLEAVESAKARGAYAQEPTTRDMLLAQGDIKSIAAMDEKGAANEIKTQIAQGRFENALQIAQMKGDFGLMIGELKAASANGSGKATELMRNWEYLKSKGYTDERAGEALLGGKVGEYVTTQTEGMDSQGNKVVTTQKTKPGAKDSAPKKTVKFGDLK